MGFRGMRLLFYVYVIFDLEGIPRYVGKGCRARWRKLACHNHAMVDLVRRSGGGLPIVKIRNGLTEQQAFEIEEALIRKIAATKRGKKRPPFSAEHRLKTSISMRAYRATLRAIALGNEEGF